MSIDLCQREDEAPLLVANVSRGPNLLEIVPPATGFANSPPAYLYSETVAEP